MTVGAAGTGVVVSSATPDLAASAGPVDVCGREIFLTCAGPTAPGAPTVVLVSGYRDSADVWTESALLSLLPGADGPPVFKALARSTRVCAYDRPGTVRYIDQGPWTDRTSPVAQPRTAGDLVVELHQLLAAADVPAPYVLMGQIIGRGLKAGRRRRLDAAVISTASSTALHVCRRRSVDDGAVFEPVHYAYDSPTTGGLGRLCGAGWSAFAKIVQSYRHWPRWPHLPPEARDALVVGGRERWRREVDLYRSDLGRLLPAGLRLPEVYGVVDLGDDRLLLMLEDVEVDPTSWDDEHFARAARLLGRMQVRITRSLHLADLEPGVPSELVQILYTSRLVPVALPTLAADETWQHPLLVTERHLRRDLDELARRLPRLIASVTALPQLRAHGDATPHNLLVPRDRPDTFVVIDWAMSGLAAVGDDLGQLLIGLAHDGVLVEAQLPALHERLVQSYVMGLAEEGYEVDEDLVRLGMDGGLAVRSAFTALPVERLSEPINDELIELCRQRLALTRYLVDVGLAATTRSHAEVA